MDSKLKISLINKISEVSKLVEQVEVFAEENEISFKILNTINLALDEIITNIISYGYSDEIEHIIEVDLSKDNLWLTVTITDDAKEFNPLDQPEPDVSKPLEEKQIGGLGIHLIRNLLDELDYKRVDGKNIFIMRKKINSD
jgi:serine/threonine-protein kinase RsbW